MAKDITIIVVSLALLAVVWVFWSYIQTWRIETIGDGGRTACTLEAKLCPDGSYVGRTGPHCEFQKCPGAK